MHPPSRWPLGHVSKDGENVDEKSEYDHESDLDDTPLQHQRAFGAGLYKKTIDFVPSSEHHLSTVSCDSSKAASSPQQQPSVGDLYLSLVLPTTTTTTTEGTDLADSNPPPSPVCETCHQPVHRATGDAARDAALHAGTLAHQASLDPDAHPPSALDRSRMGLAYLAAHGWDPDARRGLGVGQQGIRFPLKAKAKDDTLGLGVEVPERYTLSSSSSSTTRGEGEGAREGTIWTRRGGTVSKPSMLDAGKVRKMAAEDKRKTQKLHRLLSGRGPDLERYLGPGAG